MDSWQEALYERMQSFAGDSAIAANEGIEPVQLGIRQAEAYVIMKALEDQQRYLNPILAVDNS